MLKVGFYTSLYEGSHLNSRERNQQSGKERYEGDSKSKGKIHLTAVIQVTVSNFTYYFST